MIIFQQPSVGGLRKSPNGAWGHPAELSHWHSFLVKGTWRNANKKNVLQKYEDHDRLPLFCDFHVCVCVCSGVLWGSFYQYFTIFSFSAWIFPMCFSLTKISRICLKTEWSTTSPSRCRELGSGTKCWARCSVPGSATWISMATGRKEAIAKAAFLDGVSMLAEKVCVLIIRMNLSQTVNGHPSKVSPPIPSWNHTLTKSHSSKKSSDMSQFGKPFVGAGLS